MTVALDAKSVANLLIRFFSSFFDFCYLTFKSVVLLIVAVFHFALIDISHDARLASPALVLSSLVITWRLMLAMALVSSALFSAAILWPGKPIFSQADDRFTACALIWFAFGLWIWRTCVELSAIAATWWWLVFAAGLTVVALWRRRLWIIVSAALMLAVVSDKFVFYDTLYSRLADSDHVQRIVVLNWQFMVGLALAAVILFYGRSLTRRDSDWSGVPIVKMLAVLLGAFLIVWAGSFEVNRYFAKPPADLPVNADQAEQMAYSIWWALYAAVLLAIGFAVRHSPLRYMALAIFAVTLGKVFLLDMAGIEAGYRIASFVALGGLLVAASLLYQRYFQSALAKWDQTRDL